MEPVTLALWIEAITAGLTALGRLLELGKKIVNGEEVTAAELDALQEQRAKLLADLHDAAKFDRPNETN